MPFSQIIPPSPSPSESKSPLYTSEFGRDGVKKKERKEGTDVNIRFVSHTDVYNGLLDSEGEGEGGMIWENGNSNMYTVM